MASVPPLFRDDFDRRIECLRLPPTLASADGGGDLAARVSAQWLDRAAYLVAKVHPNARVDNCRVG